MKFFFVFTFFLSSVSLSGQNTISSAVAGNVYPDSLKVAENRLPEILVLAFRSAGLLKSASGSVSVIPADRVENSALNIASSLSTVPGLVIQEGTPGTIKLTLRGIGSRYPYGTKKIKLFFGEIPMYSAEGETTFDDINPEYISRIEVLRGPASSIYGASLGGTLLLYPLKSEINSEEVSLRSAAGSFGYFKNGLSYSKGTPQNDLLISLSGIQSGGYRENNNYSRNSFFLNHHQRFRTNLTGNLVISGSKINAQIPSSVDSASYADHPERAAANWLKTKGYEHPDRIFAGYNLQYGTVENWNYSTSIFLNSRKTEENRPFNYLNENDFSYGARFLVQHDFESGTTKWRLNAGTNLYFENIRSLLFENIGGNGVKGALQQDGKEVLFQSDFFGQLEVRMNKVAITGGINLNRSGFRNTDLFTSDTLQQSGNYHFEPIFAPRLAITWNPLTDLYLYSSINKGFSTPSLSETLSPLGLINREIKPEKAWSYEGGVRANLFNRNTFIDLAGYYMRVTDLIVPKRIAEDIYVGMNAGTSSHKGLELALQQWIIGGGEMVAARPVTLKANVAYAVSRFNFLSFTQDNIDYSGKKLPGMPDQLFSGALDLKVSNRFYTRFELNCSGEIPLNDFNNRYSGAWMVMNLKAGYLFKMFKKLNFDAAIKINNLADENYASMVVVNAPGTLTRPPRYFYPGLPRWFIGTVNISYRNFRN
jgi:iron complex outermembrane receptor protein